ncbi:T. brucei spp.-specific protein [Trypanosoma brucei gambiense DAL972]|uniref:T. brucei spp.-specific protein n=1 Tax=Trypanosoma brucei gambiense (strain MHOM/CI/86/DAL972) TaxID=679716 RepID=C9ZMV1_TRYB9|nr:T. brucei spp.-specific protein [Trypanosoma brucei gambiense DAL972]CBH10604.1 T. brucei spp.-specific protein [Trypanosoma brucei gambiense DAL972]|eukprot:XP_011772893.1 T. brucei spp.-specific protein [Trypanosoma brucei gambiense DAL972]
MTTQTGGKNHPSVFFFRLPVRLRLLPWSNDDMNHSHWVTTGRNLHLHTQRCLLTAVMHENYNTNQKKMTGIARTCSSACRHGSNNEKKNTSTL